MPHDCRKSEARITAILELAEALGRFPTYREASDKLSMGSTCARLHMPLARERWDGPLSASTLQKSNTSRVAPLIVGVRANETRDDAALLERAYRMQDAHARLMQRKRDQSITLQNEPVGVAFLSDVHFGAPGTDYRTAFEDARLIRDTPGMHAVFHGDGVDNFIVGRLSKINFSRELTIDDEWRLLKLWVNTIGDKWVAAVSGNHDQWTNATAGIDYLRSIMSAWGPLYDNDDCVFTLRVGENEWVVRVRHKWRGSSIYNPTHGIEVGWERAGQDFDIGVGGHTHRGTVIRPFIKHKRERFAVLTGAYKLEDSYGRQEGFAPVHSTGAAAILFRPDGLVLPCPDLGVAAATLRAWRG